MKIERRLVPEMTIEDFADREDLTLEIHERSQAYCRGLPRFIASFQGVELKEGFLSSSYGNGETEAEAIADYAAKISERFLVIDAYGPNRRELVAPRFVLAMAGTAG